MKSVIVLLLWPCGIPALVNAQNLQTLSYLNETGIYGTLSNPANAACGTNKLSVNIFGVGAGVENNLFTTRFSYSLLGIASMQPKRDHNPELSAPYYLLQDKSVKHPAFNVNAQVLLPSIQYQISPKFTVYAYLRDRVVGNLDKTNSQTVNYLVNEQFGGDITNASIRADVRMFAFHENALGFAAEIYNRRESMIKAGITIKQLSSQFAYILNVPDVNLSLNNDMISLLAKYRMVKTNTDNISTSPMNWITGQHAVGKGYGADIGLVYEYRPYHMRHRYIVNNPRGRDKNFRQRDKLKYKYRISWSLMDIGSVRYSGSQNISDKRYEIAATLPAVYADSFKQTGFRSKLMENARLVSESNTLRMVLPAVMLTGFDYRFSDRWFMNLTYQQNLKRRSEWGSVYNPTRFSCLLRKEGKTTTYGFPLTVVPSSRTLTVGGIIKAGPAFVGTDNIRTLVSKQLYNCSVYAGIVINIRYKSDPTIENFRAF